MQNSNYYPVTVVEIKPTSDPETFNVELEQRVPRPIKSAGALLALTMEGHEKFGSAKVRRVAYQNFSGEVIKARGLQPGSDIGKAFGVDAKIVIKETTTPRTWIDKGSGETKFQSPKKAGEDGEILTHQGAYIYRNYELAVTGMSFEDILLDHDQVITGSSSKEKTVETEQTVGNPQLA